MKAFANLPSDNLREYELGRSSYQKAFSFNEILNKSIFKFPCPTASRRQEIRILIIQVLHSVLAQKLDAHNLQLIPI